MEVLQFLEHKGKKIAYLNLSSSNCERRLIISALEGLKPIFESQPLNSMLTLTNVEGLVFSSDILKAFKEFTEHNKPHVKAGAVIGIRGIQKIAYDAIMKFSNRHLPIFETLEEAKEWLVQQ